MIDDEASINQSINLYLPKQPLRDFPMSKGFFSSHTDYNMQTSHAGRGTEGFHRMGRCSSSDEYRRTGHLPGRACGSGHIQNLTCGPHTDAWRNYGQSGILVHKPHTPHSQKTLGRQTLFQSCAS